MNGLLTGETPPGDDQGGTPPATPPATPPPAADPPPAGDPPPDDDNSRPDYLPAEAFGEDGAYDPKKHLELLRGTVRPEAADKYELPTIDGLDAEQLAASPVVAAMRNAAHKSGLSQEEFAGVFTDYIEAEKTRASEITQAELAKLGDNHKQRLAAIDTFLGSSLPAAQAKALAASATSAAAVEAIEALIRKAGGGRTGGTGGSGAGGGSARKSREEIQQLMESTAYSGNASQRDAKVVAEVDKWFEEEAKANPRRRA